jgi:hypothetical protein
MWVIAADAAGGRTCVKCAGGFEDMAPAAAAAGHPLEDLRPDEWEQLWARAKQNESVADRGLSGVKESLER